jgi:hypothetical protein
MNVPGIIQRRGETVTFSMLSTTADTEKKRELYMRVGNGEGRLGRGFMVKVESKKEEY